MTAGHSRGQHLFRISSDVIASTTRRQTHLRLKRNIVTPLKPFVREFANPLPMNVNLMFHRRLLAAVGYCLLKV